MNCSRLGACVLLLVASAFLGCEDQPAAKNAPKVKTAPQEIVASARPGDVADPLPPPMLQDDPGIPGGDAASSKYVGDAGPTSRETEQTPALVVVVSVDQWAYEYFERFRKNLADNGIAKRTQATGAWYRNCLHQHAFTFTGPGHSVLLTGAYPNRNGIIGNSWFDRASGTQLYCVADPEATLIGDTADTKVSPKHLLVETVGDQLKLATHGKSKVFSVAIKDRAAILMAGHLGDAAFWMANAGPWITTDHYRNDVPGYLRQIDYKTYAGATWELLLPAEEYQHGATEDSTAENPGYGMTADFPHQLAAEDDEYFVNQLACSPFGNEITLEAARQIINYEQLGQDEYPDILGINLSSADYVGHAFGPESLEVEDMTYRTDIALGDFADYVDAQMGDKPWVMFVTADHGVAPVPERAAAMGLDAKRNALGSTGTAGNIPSLRDPLEAYLRGQLGVAEDPENADSEDGEETEEAPQLVQAVTDHAVFLNRDSHPALSGDRFELACELARDWLLNQDAIVAAVTRQNLLGEDTTDSELTTLFRHAFHPARSGDVLFAQKPFYFQGGATSTHGSPWRYDRHIPLMVLGNVSHADVETEVSPAAIAPTIARLLHIPQPAACEESPLPDVIGQD